MFLHRPHRQNSPCHRSHAWNLSVSKGSKLVHSVGHPMSQATHWGFREPFNSSGVTMVRSLALAPLPPQSRRAEPNVGVGQYPDSLSDVRSAGIVRAQHSPSSIEPHRGQVPENSSKSTRSEHWAVFHEDEAGSNLANDPGHLSPKAGSLSVNPCSLPCAADVLAGESPGHDIDPPSPGVPIEGSDVIPDWEPGEDAVSLALEQDSPRVFLQFNGADWNMSEKEAAEDSSPCPCKKV